MLFLGCVRAPFRQRDTKTTHPLFTPSRFIFFRRQILVAAGAKLITAVFGAIQTGKVALALQIIAGAPIEDINAPGARAGVPLFLCVCV